MVKLNHQTEIQSIDRSALLNCLNHIHHLYLINFLITLQIKGQFNSLEKELVSFEKSLFN